MTTLGDAADFLSGGTPKKRNPAYWGGDIPWFSASNMNRRFLLNSDIKITDAGLEAGSKLAPKGATLLLVRGSGLFNSIPICFAEEPVAFNQDVKAICAKDHVDPTYLHFWIETLRSRLSDNIGVTGIGAGKFDTDYLKSLPFPDVSKKEQEGIAVFASSFDRKIELNRQMNETLEGMARAIYKDWFVDFGPIRAKMAGEKPYLAPELWPIFPDKLDDDGTPEGWEMGTLVDISDTNSESWTVRNHPDMVEYVDLSNTKWGIIESTASLKWDKAPSRARRIVKNGDTIVGTTRPGNGSFAYISNDGYTASTGFAVLSPRKAIYRDLVYITATNSENIIRLANLADGHGGAYPAVKPDVVSATKLVLAGDEIITAFADITSELRKKIEQSKAEICTLAKTRDLLLPKLMSGEIHVRDAEKQIGEAG